MSACRLCGAETEALFKKTVFQKYEVTYHRCTGCESLQTDTPYWLEEIYADPRPITDVGMVQRCQDLCMKSDAVLSLFGVDHMPVALDWGGGNGLFTRMMRDRGYNFYCHEPYTPNFYTPYYDTGLLPDLSAAVLTAFEVFEHLPNPAEDLKEIFTPAPDLMLVTTELYSGQGSDWPYLSTDNGQHVFFYSPKAFQMLAAQYGYQLLSDGILHLFCRKKPEKLAYDFGVLSEARLLFNDPAALLKRALDRTIQHSLNPYRFVQKDYVDIVAKLRQGDAPPAYK